MKKTLLYVSLIFALWICMSACAPIDYGDENKTTLETSEYAVTDGFTETISLETSAAPEETTLPVTETALPEELLNSPIANFSPEMKASEILEEVKKGGYVVLSRDTNRIVAGEELIDEFISLTQAGESMSLFVANYRSEPYGFPTGGDYNPVIILTEIVYDGELYFGYHATYYDNAALLNKNKPILEHWIKGYKYMLALDYENGPKNDKSLWKMYVAADDPEITHKYITKVWDGVLFAEGWGTFEIVVDYKY